MIINICNCFILFHFYFHGQFLDGWELNGEVFPPVADVPMQGRVEEFCGRHQRKVFVSTSNAASLLYSLPRRGDVFKITVKFIKHPTRELIERIKMFGLTSKTTVSQDVQTRFSMQLSFAKFLSKIKGIFNTRPVSWIQHSLQNLLYFRKELSEGQLYRKSVCTSCDTVVLGEELNFEKTSLVIQTN